MRIRTLKATDVAAYQALRLRALREEPLAFAAAPEDEAERPLDEVAERLAPKPGACVYGAFDERLALVGMVGLEREGMKKLSHKAWIWGLYVLPDARRHGVAWDLMRHAIAQAGTAMRVQQINIGVNTENRPALTLYERLGFVTYGTERGFLLHEGVLHDEYCMALRLGPGST